jgi:hypothetical protein
MTEAPGTAAPLTSVTVPTIEPLVVCASRRPSDSSWIDYEPKARPIQVNFELAGHATRTAGAPVRWTLFLRPVARRTHFQNPNIHHSLLRIMHLKENQTMAKGMDRKKETKKPKKKKP